MESGPCGNMAGSPTDKDRAEALMRGSVLGVLVIFAGSFGCSGSSSREAPEAGTGDHADAGPARTDAPPEPTDAGTVSSVDGGRAIGAACVPAEESDRTFQGFSVTDVSIEPTTGGCGPNVCMLNHFQGRVTCPYGQTAPGEGPAGPAGSPAAKVHSEDGCVLPQMTPGAGSTTWQVTATDVSVTGFSAGTVPPQIIGVGAGDRTANKTVYCSCRCANVDGVRDDAGPYCACPSGLTCTPLVTPVVPGDKRAGSYCVLDGTGYSAATTNAASVCDATMTDPSEPGYCPVQTASMP